MSTWFWLAIATAAGMLLALYLLQAMLRASYSERELSSSNPPRRVDENVQFTVYRPKAIAPECWYPLIAFAHLTSKRADASPHEPDPIKEVKLQATALLGERLVTEYRPVTQDSDSSGDVVGIR
jgi:hypothetical protein